MSLPLFFFFFFNATATTEIYTLSLHDALPILRALGRAIGHDLELDEFHVRALGQGGDAQGQASLDRKSTRLNSSHVEISYAVFCLKKKKKTNNSPHVQKSRQTS